LTKRIETLESEVEELKKKQESAPEVRQKDA